MFKNEFVVFLLFYRICSTKYDTINTYLQYYVFIAIYRG
ncbi:protein of unknown function [Clostridium beijerinckii]|nr:protein of unknown function [Clostridium beijerinckii]